MPALGRTGLDVRPLCLGGNVFGWTADGERSFALLDAYRRRDDPPRGGSLERLQTDRIGPYDAHVDDEATPLEETLAAWPFGGRR